MMKKTICTVVFLFYLVNIVFAQTPEKLGVSEIHESIQKLNFLGTVLYVAAHPDDENTNLISYFSNHVKARTAYLSLTRGDGGQNLIGPEIREMLGAIRTEELLAARSVDGGEQFFSRANDFGFSKHPEETLQIWDEEKVLEDVVLAIRKFRPDIIINRFSNDPKTFGSTHGHHSSSAVLSVKAFDVASDKNSYTHQLEKLAPWQPKRVFFNTSWWFYGSKENFDNADKSLMLKIDTGVFYPSVGLSNTEIASLSRSMHKSQGFGTTGKRGEYFEYVEYIKGIGLPKSENLFEGINTTWSRVKGGEEIGEILSSVENNFDFTNPSKSVPQLLEAYQKIQALENVYWREQKTKEIKAIIAACMGLFLEAKSNEQVASYNDIIKVDLELINRSDLEVKLVKTELLPGIQIDHTVLELLNNQNNELQFEGKIPSSINYTSPYWLNDKSSLGSYFVANKDLIGLPETPIEIKVRFTLLINGINLTYDKNVIYKYNDPVLGEVYKPFEVLPEATVNIDKDVVVFSEKKEQEIKVSVKSLKSNLKGQLSIDLPKGWKVIPSIQEVDIKEKGFVSDYYFKVFAPKKSSVVSLTPKLKIGEKVYGNKLEEIDYSHIPFQSVLLPSKTKLVNLNVKTTVKKIGYIQGAGDLVPDNLKELGCEVTILDPTTMNLKMLQQFEVVILGVRVYNTIDNVKFWQNTLHEYIHAGGTVIAQYNTSRGVKVDNVAPYPLQLSWNRVTDEKAKVEILEPKHPILNYPNKISDEDFEGWVQERGLYFPSSWDKSFTPIFAMKDKGENVSKGSLLVAQYGDGYFIYTGLSFFRELPAGIPGAYRLFANMLSIGNHPKK